MIDIFENCMKQSIYTFSKREVLLCHMVRRKIDEISSYHLRHKENTEFKPIEFALEIRGALYAYGIDKHVHIFDLYCQRIFAKQTKSGIDVFNWQKSINEYHSMQNGIDVQVRTINKDDANVLFKDNVDAEILKVKHDIAMAKENGDTSSVTTLSRKLAGLSGIFHEQNHMVRVVSFPRYNMGFIYILSTKAKVTNYSDNVVSLGKGIAFGDPTQEQFMVDYGIRVTNINIKLKKYDTRLVEENSHPLNILQAYGRDTGRAAFQAVMYGTDPYNINSKKKVVDDTETEVSTVAKEKFEIQDDFFET